MKKDEMKIVIERLMNHIYQHSSCENVVLVRDELYECGECTYCIIKSEFEKRKILRQCDSCS